MSGRGRSQAAPPPLGGLLARFRHLFAAPPDPAPAAVLPALVPAPPLTQLRLIDQLAGPLDPAIQVLFEDATAGKVVIDRLARVLRTNGVLGRMLGDGVPVMVGIAVEDLFAPADRIAAAREIAEALAGAPPRAVTLRLAGAGATEIGGGTVVSLQAAPLVEADGHVSGAILRVVDVTLNVRLEAQLAHSQRLQAAGQLAGGIAHDFNNLLTAILGATDAIAQRRDLDPEVRDDLGAIRASAERGAALVRQLLAFGRRQTLQPRALAVNHVVGALAVVLRRLLGSRVRLDLALERPGRFVRVDPTALDQVLLNLAVNARDAMPQGGTLTLHTGHMVINRPLPRGPETIPPGSYVMLEVQDSGIGIGADVLPHIFEPFFTTKRETGGSGLGLSTVLGIVRQSDGFLAVESEPGGGTRMRVYLPRWEGPVDDRPAAANAADAAAADVAPGVQPRLPFLEPPAAARGTLLLVDDEDTVRRVAERALSRQGWRVISAESAEAALEALTDQAPALTAVVTDLVMPGMDGTALVQAVRDLLGAPRLPAVLVSGYAGEELRQNIATELGGGATRFLPKPYDMKELAAKLAEVVA